MGTTGIQKESTGKRVVLFLSMTSRIADKRVYFLFSVKQVEEIVREAPVRPVPLAPAHLEGIVWWRGLLLPVLSLEGCLGMETHAAEKASRFMVVRADPGETSNAETLRCMLRVDSTIRMTSPPRDCVPITLNGELGRRDLIRGLYEWKNGYLVIPHMQSLLRGQTIDLGGAAIRNASVKQTV